jgi:hypothetical protein
MPTRVEVEEMLGEHDRERQGELAGVGNADHLGPPTKQEHTECHRRDRCADRQA